MAPKRLLLFENPRNNILHFLSSVLQRAGYVTNLVHTAEDCISAVQATRPDATLMIVNNIHDACPFELVLAIRRLHPDCGFVFLAGADTEDTNRFLSAGYEFTIYPLPIEPSELLTTISGALNNPAATFVTPSGQLASPLDDGLSEGKGWAETCAAIAGEFASLREKFFDDAVAIIQFGNEHVDRLRKPIMNAKLGGTSDAALRAYQFMHALAPSL